MVAGQCKDMEIEFVNDTGLEVDIPREGHRVKNPGGGFEGYNKMTLGTSVNNLAPGSSMSTQQTLNIKCSDDAEFEIHYSSSGGPHIQIFTNVNIEDKYASLSLTLN